MFSRVDFIALAAHLSAITGRFILSVNDVPETREIFERFAVETVATRYVRCDGDCRDRAVCHAAGC